MFTFCVNRVQKMALIYVAFMFMLGYNIQYNSASSKHKWRYKYMKILAVCGNGLGSSFMISINVNKVMKKLGIEGECKNLDLASAKTEQADFYIGSPEILEQLNDGSRKVIPLINVVDLSEIESALKKNILEEA